MRVGKEQVFPINKKNGSGICPRDLSGFGEYAVEQRVFVLILRKVVQKSVEPVAELNQTAFPTGLLPGHGQAEPHALTRKAQALPAHLATVQGLAL